MNHLLLLTRIAIFMLISVLIPAQTAMAQKEKKPFTLVIDPGHGGVDPGAIGGKAKEKDINMSVSKLLASMIKEKYPEVKVIFTRTKDVKIPLAQRANIANNANADLFISIHSNASKSRSANGCETFTLGAGSSAEAKKAAMYENEVILSEENFETMYSGFDPRSSESYIIFELIRSHDMELSADLAQMVQKGMTRNAKLKDRGVSSAGFLVLHRTVMPSILVELGFITNGKDRAVIATKEGQKKLAKGIFEGFSEYYKTYHKKDGKTVTRNTANKAVTNESNSTQDAPKTTETQTTKDKGKPVFKVQILTATKKLGSKDKRLKGVKASYYVEKGVYKYTYGESENYNLIVKKRKEILPKFKEAFIIAFMNGKRIDTQEAIRIFKNSK
jgi:N-acetylmuramoyl-L-alanine amidase